MMETFKHVLVRSYLCFLLGLFFITGGLAMFVFAPLYKWAFAPRASLRDLPVLSMWAHVYKVIWRSISDKSYRDMYPSKITDPPKLHTDRGLVRVSAAWHGAEDNCDACLKTCCSVLKCPLFGKDGRCAGYDSLFFNYFFCGRYPENQAQIDYYDCPKWEVTETGVVGSYLDEE